MNQALPPSDPVMIICGGGSVPFAIADAVQRRGGRVFLYAIKGWADPQKVPNYPHAWAPLGQFGRVLRTARNQGCRQVIFIGTVVRPAIREIRLDWTTLRLLPRIARQFFGGDDHLLKGIAGIFGEHGLEVVAAQDLAPEILVPEGPFTRQQPSTQDQADIAHGLSLLKAMAPFDVGQAVIVAGRYVLAVEAAEGTDLMLTRLAELRRMGRVRSPAGAGVLVKSPKPGQDRRLDLPTIGPKTIEAAAKAGLAGVAVVAGGTILAEPERVRQVADEAKIFVVGLPEQHPA